MNYPAPGIAFVPPPETFFLAYRGSIAHNMFVPSTDPQSIDDIDLMGFVYGDEANYFGLHEWGSRGTKEIKQGAYDVVLYEIRKAVSLLLQGNPNIMSMLWVAPDYVLLSGDDAAELRAGRQIFVGKHVYNAFAGYAYQQLEKMETRDQRKHLVLEHGYDAKNAAHLIRLLRMCIEFMQTGEMIVKRPDAAELLDIKAGKWTLASIKELSTQLFAEAKAAKEKSQLPAEPDREGAERLLIKLVRQRLLA